MGLGKAVDLNQGGGPRMWSIKAHGAEHGYGYSTPKPYSTDIAAAWEVVEKLLGDCRGHLMGGISRGWEREGGPLMWCCTFPGFKTAWADTAPMAICLAALKTLT